MWLYGLKQPFPYTVQQHVLMLYRNGSLYLSIQQLETSHKERGNDVTANLYLGISAAAFLALMEIKPSAREKAI